MEPLVIRQVEPQDQNELAALRHCLWPNARVEEHSRELTLLLAGTSPGTLPNAILVAQEPGGRIVGFVEVGLRSHADGCDPSRPVGYLEGWYVIPECRGHKVGARLVAEAEAWARSKGCKEMASDTWLDNLESQKAHEALGFEVVDRCVNYRKPL